MQNVPDFHSESEKRGNIFWRHFLLTKKDLSHKPSTTIKMALVEGTLLSVREKKGLVADFDYFFRAEVKNEAE